MRFPLIGIRADRKRATAKHRAEAPGGTTSKSHVVRHVPAFPRNSSMRIMVFVWSATQFAENVRYFPSLGGKTAVDVKP